MAGSAEVRCGAAEVRGHRLGSLKPMGVSIRDPSRRCQRPDAAISTPGPGGRSTARLRAQLGHEPVCRHALQHAVEQAQVHSADQIGVRPARACGTGSWPARRRRPRSAARSPAPRAPAGRRPAARSRRPRARPLPSSLPRRRAEPLEHPPRRLPRRLRLVERRGQQLAGQVVAAFGQRDRDRRTPPAGRASPAGRPGTGAPAAAARNCTSSSPSSTSRSRWKAAVARGTPVAAAASSRLTGAGDRTTWS